MNCKPVIETLDYYMERLRMACDGTVGQVQDAKSDLGRFVGRCIAEASKGLPPGVQHVHIDLCDLGHYRLVGEVKGSPVGERCEKCLWMGLQAARAELSSLQSVGGQ